MTLILCLAGKIRLAIHEEGKCLVITDQDVLMAGLNLVLQLDYTH